MDRTRKMRLSGVGEILFERSPRARHINLSIRPFKGVRVAVPRGVSYQEALAVAYSKVEWLQSHLARMAKVERAILERRDQPPIDWKSARRQLLERIEYLARLHGFNYRKIFVRSQKTRWGSCSLQNNINLNIKLVLLPADLIDYTLLHELVHIRVKNHGPEFWSELARYVDDPRRLDRRMNSYWMLLLGDR